jgi:Phage integrase, N-terminal SAM-like domain
MSTTTTSSPSTAVAVAEPVFTNAERLALAGFLAGYTTGLTREAYALDLRQFTAWCQQRRLQLLQARRADIECFARDLEARGRARATVTRRLCTIAGLYKYAVEEELLGHSPAAHVRRPRLDYESHATGLDRNELGAMLVAAGLGTAAEHESVLAAGASWPETAIRRQTRHGGPGAARRRPAIPQPVAAAPPGPALPLGAGAQTARQPAVCLATGRAPRIAARPREPRRLLAMRCRRPGTVLGIGVHRPRPPRHVAGIPGVGSPAGLQPAAPVHAVAAARGIAASPRRRTEVTRPTPSRRARRRQPGSLHPAAGPRAAPAAALAPGLRHRVRRPGRLGRPAGLAAAGRPRRPAAAADPGRVRRAARLRRRAPGRQRLGRRGGRDLHPVAAHVAQLRAPARPARRRRQRAGPGRLVRGRRDRRLTRSELFV